MRNIEHKLVRANGILMHVAELGQGPAVLLCHGFPETWYSWRHQLTALADAGFRVIAPDMRGFGKTERPQAIEDYSLLHLVGDMVGLLDSLGIETAAIAGHDWGAPVAWHAALLRPDRFRGVIGISVPFIPRGQVYTSRVLPTTTDTVFYQEYFQTPGVAEADMERDVRLRLRTALYSLSGDAPMPAEGSVNQVEVAMVPRGSGMPGINPETLPSWINETDIDAYVEQFSRTGFRGGLNWYRNVSRNWDLFAPFEGLKINVPALFVAGERDIVLAFKGMTQLISNLTDSVPLLRKTIILPGCGHWTQQERPHEVNAALIDFLTAPGPEK